MFVCLFVCLFVCSFVCLSSARSHNLKTTRPNFTKFLCMLVAVAAVAAPRGGDKGDSCRHGGAPAAHPTPISTFQASGLATDPQLIFHNSKHADLNCSNHPAGTFFNFTADLPPSGCTVSAPLAKSIAPPLAGKGWRRHCVARSSSDGTAISYVLPVLRMTSRFRSVGPMGRIKHDVMSSPVGGTRTSDNYNVWSSSSEC